MSRDEFRSSDPHSNIRFLARELDTRFSRPQQDGAPDEVVPFVRVWPGGSSLARDIAETGVRATLTKHLGNLDDSPPLFAETLAAIEAAS